ncbi:ATP-binding protein [Streptomyces sp. HNM0645]|nr:ATP-binding protein [Streptomyces sp. HNM0645]MDI9888372.1 ATP-binding protein [Streptomyces sp. HNM0645]
MAVLGSAECPRVTLANPDRVLQVPHIPEGIAAVRRRAHALLAGWDLPTESLEVALLVISELITNAIVHALPPATLRLRCSENEGPRTLRIDVTDGGPSSQVWRPTGELESDEHGRGIGIVVALSASYGTYAHRDRVTRWAELSMA